MVFQPWKVCSYIPLCGDSRRGTDIGEPKVIFDHAP